ncbi:unnamed protein product [Ostreobium quekettii]|uniref:PHD-type domain-containing protein n=1 Tax=Ostreobium quekettii TaxID=121088 RepID=A0A8S1JEP1_9CHLO|nr:unnamed protein product [Ostreobium quekettii]
MATLGGSQCEALKESKCSSLPQPGLPTPGKRKSKNGQGKKAGRQQKDNRFLVHFKFAGVKVCMWEAGSLRLMGTPFKGREASPAQALEAPSFPSTEEGDHSRSVKPEASTAGLQRKASCPKSPSATPKQRKRPSKKPKNGGELQQNPLKMALQRVKNHVQTIKREELLLSAYQSNGWNGASRNVVKPTAELQRARLQIQRSQHKVRECVAICDEAGGDTAMPDSAFDEHGDPIVDAIACSRCGGLASEEKGNDIVLCDGPCRRAYHQLCLVPPITMEDLERDTWLCPACDCKNEILAMLNEHFETSYSLATKADALFRMHGDGERSPEREREASVEPTGTCTPVEGSDPQSQGGSSSEDDGEVPIATVLAGELASEDDDEDEDFSPEEDSDAQREGDAREGDVSPSSSSSDTDDDSDVAQDGNLEHQEVDTTQLQSLDAMDVCQQSPFGGKRSWEEQEALPGGRSKRRRKVVNYVKLDQALCRDGALREEDDDDGDAEEYVPKEMGTDGDDTDWDGGDNVD